ncbi:MAG TPA: hypothetical protein VH016_01865 [Actinomycetota bacterium]|nr:hypothetical protein [Actinomycetota bacterium]
MAATVLLLVVYLSGAVLALVLGSPAQRLLGLAVLAIVAVRVTALRAARRGASPWS